MTFQGASLDLSRGLLLSRPAYIERGQASAQVTGSTQGSSRGSTCGPGWCDSDGYLCWTPPSGPARPGVGSVQHASTHVQQGTHMLISGSPWCKRLGGGGSEHSRVQAAAKIHWNLVPPPQAPISGCGGHNSRCGYPPIHSHWAASFSTTSARDWSWGTAPHPLPPSWPPSHWCSASSCPTSIREDWLYVWAVSFPQSPGGLRLECVGMGWHWKKR